MVYNHFVASSILEMNCAQAMVVYKLSSVFESLAQEKCCTTQRGVYIHGSVGCGKTMAMDIFAACVHIALPHLRLYRIHLNRFLETVHSTLRLLGSCGPDMEIASPATSCRFAKTEVHKPFNLGRQDDRGMRRTGSAAAWMHVKRSGSVPTSIDHVAELLAQKLDVLCLDEMSITNLQNCVLLGPLIHALGSKGVVIIATSNKAPDDLYEEGLDRELHLPILTSAIRERCDVMHLVSSIDYRKLLARAEGHCQVFKWQCEKLDSHAFVDSWWAALAGTDKPCPVSVGYGRQLRVLQSRDEKCARFSFADLCTYPPVALGSADYVELCSRFHTVLVSDVPRLRPEVLDAARRWTFFLDSCYENHIRVIISTTAANPEDMLDLTEIEKGGSDGQSLQEASFAVSRCVSRLYEMQSQLYLDAFRSRLDQETVCGVL
jgi:cell division protein ZapE